MARGAAPVAAADRSTLYGTNLRSWLSATRCDGVMLGPFSTFSMTFSTSIGSTRRRADLRLTAPGAMLSILLGRVHDDVSLSL